MTRNPDIDAEKWRTVATSLRVWLCEVLLWLAEHLDGRIARAFRIGVRRDLHRAEKSLRAAIVLIALSRVSWAEVPGRKTFRPGSVIRTRSSADMRHVTRIIRFRELSLRKRIQRLHDVIDVLDVHVARMIARLEAGFRQLGPILMVRLAMLAGVADDAPAFADSS